MQFNCNGTECATEPMKPHCMEKKLNGCLGLCSTLRCGHCGLRVDALENDLLAIVLKVGSMNVLRLQAHIHG